MTSPPRWVPALLVVFLPVWLAAYQFESADIQNALQRHDLRKLETIATTAETPLRLNALESLIQLKDPQTLPFLVSQLDDTDPEIIQTVLWGLPAFGAQAATPEIIARVEESQQKVSIDVRKAAAVVLEDLRDPDKLQQMHQNLTSKESDLHKEALAFYIQRKDLSILRDARAMLQDADPTVKQTGILLIHGLDDRDRFDAVTTLLHDPSPTVRATAAWVVGEWKEADALDLLAPLLNDPEPLVRGSVITILGKHQNPQISTALAGLTKDKAASVRIALAKALPQFASPASANGLLDLALDDNPLVRDPAIAGLAAFHDAVVTHKMNGYLTDKTSRRRRRAAVEYFFESPGTAGKAQLVYLLNDPEKDIRLTVLRKMPVLLKVPNVKKSVIKTSLTKLAKDPDPEVQALAKKYLPVVN